MIGGYAVGFHGYVRTTADCDVWIGMDPQNAQRMVDVLREFGFDVPELRAELFTNPDQLVRMGVKPYLIEIMTTISGVDFAECYRERRIENIDGIPVNVIQLRHLKINKLASGRGKDLIDLENLPPEDRWSPDSQPKA